MRLVYVDINTNNKKLAVAFGSPCAYINGFVIVIYVSALSWEFRDTR